MRGRFVAPLVTRHAFWRCRSALRVWIFKLYSQQDSLRSSVRQQFENQRTFWTFVRSALRVGVAGATTLTITELLAFALASAPISWIAQAGKRAPIDPDFEAFVGPIVGAQASFIGLFFATVGIVASTTYSNVPGDIRRLFIQERASATFVRIASRTLVIGLGILLLRSFDYSPHLLTLAVLASLVVVSAASLARLSTELFEYFDVALLARPLRAKFHAALRLSVTATWAAFDDSRMTKARVEVQGVFDLYRRITRLLTLDTSIDIRGAGALAKNLIEDWRTYARLKPRLKPDSAWFAKVPRYKNLLALGYTEAIIHASTRTAPQPTLSADRLWLERRFTDRIGNLLSFTLRPGMWTEGLKIVHSVEVLIFELGALLQLDEAIMLSETVSRELRAAVGRVGNDEQIQGVVSRNELAAWAKREEAIVEFDSQIYLQLLLGFAQSAVRFERVENFADYIQVSDSGASIWSVVPFRVAQQRQRLDVGISLERSLEGRTVTPAWWIDHEMARTLVESIVAGTERLLGHAQAGLLSPLFDNLSVNEGNAPIVAQQSLAAMEFANKAQFHLPRLQRTVEHLTKFRSERVAEASWGSVGDGPVEKMASVERDASILLARAMPYLDSSPFEPERLDLFGLAYLHLFESLFQAVISEDETLAAALFPSVLLAADSARTRIGRDFPAAESRLLALTALDPLVGLMELSGYAYLLSEAGGGKLWAAIRDVWSSTLEDSGPELTDLLITAAVLVAAPMGLSAGSAGRMSREQRFREVLAQKGFGDVGRPSRRRRRGAQDRTLNDTPDGLKLFCDDFSIYSASDYFLAKFMASRDQRLAEAFPRSARSLMNELERMKSGEEND